MSGEDLWKVSFIGDVTTVKLLLAAGVDPDIYRGLLNSTAIHAASRYGHTEVVRALLDAGANPSPKGGGGATPLIWSATEGYLDIAKLLIQAGANVHEKTVDGDSSLHRASYFGHLDMVKYFIEDCGAKALLHIKGMWGDTPKMRAQRGNHEDVIEYLTSVEDKYGTTTHSEPAPHTSILAAVPISPVQSPKIKGESSNVFKLSENLLTDAQAKTASSLYAIDGVSAEQLSSLSVSTACQDRQNRGAIDKSYDTHLENYSLNFSEPLGKGAWGEVYKARHVDGGPIVALKRVTWNINLSKLKIDPRREIETYKAIPKHANIVSLLDHTISDRYLVLVMELCTVGDLESYFLSSPPDLAENLELMDQACSGLLHLHSLTPPIVHRDVKPKNLLLTRQQDRLVLKIADFGFAKLMEESKLGTLCGTATYIAPEVLPNAQTNVVQYTKECDIFSLGLVYHAMASFKLADKELSPKLEKVDIGSYAGDSVAIQMQQAFNKGSQLPRLKEIGGPDDFVMSKLNLIISWMTKFNPKQRIALPTISREIKAFRDAVFSCSKT